MSTNDPNSKLFNPSLINSYGSMVNTITGAVMNTPGYAVSSEVRAMVTEDIIIDGVSLNHTLKTIQDRLAILVPDPAKLEKYQTLKNLYDQYKTVEALIGEDNMAERK